MSQRETPGADQRLYCQQCGREVTDSGGLVDQHGRVYCFYTGCTLTATVKSNEDAMFFNSYNPAELKELASQRKLFHNQPVQGKSATR